MSNFVPKVYGDLMSLKDLQKQKLYGAENLARANARKNAETKWIFFTDLEETQDHAFSFANLLDIKLAAFNRTRGHRTATAQKWRMAVNFPNSQWAWNGYVVVHELTHLQVHSAFPSHGIEYAQQFLRNVHICLGKEAWQMLRSAFVERKIAFEYDEAHQKHVERVIKWKLKQPVHTAPYAGSFGLILKDGTTVEGPNLWKEEGTNAELGRKAYSLVEQRAVAYVF